MQDVKGNIIQKPSHEVMKQEIFRLICVNDICMMNPGYVVSTRTISKCLDITYYFAKKFCKQLEQEGLIVYKKEYIPDQFDYETGMELQQEAFWNVGWETTKKAQDTDIWKIESEKEEKLIKECFGD